jgi:Leucine-rich repeat (LRR) protein
MTKHYFLVIALITFAANAQIVNIPDPLFKGSLVTHFPTIDTNSDGEIQTTEALAVTSVEIITNGTDLTGIEAFQNLTTLKLELCLHLTTVNLSSLTNLQNLTLSQNNILANANLSGMTGLTSLHINDTQVLTSLNLSGTINITDLALIHMGLTTLDLSIYPNLQVLNCSANLLTSLDLSSVGNLTQLDCNTNQLLTLDVSGLTNLTNLRCDRNQLSALNVLPLTQLTALNCGYNMIADLDLSGLTQLTNLACHVNILSALDLTPLINLTALDCTSNHISTLDLSHSPNLNSLLCISNDLTALDVTNLSNLAMLRIENNDIASLDLTQNTKLHIFFGGGNPITTLDFSNVVADPANGDGAAYLFSNMPDLEYINLKSGITQNYMIGADNCPNLAYVCVNEAQVAYMTSQFAFTQAQVNSYCTFVPGTAHNTINGTVGFDLDNNGCDVSDIHYPIKVEIASAAGTGSTFTREPAGTYTFYTLAGNHTLTPILENPYFTISPASAVVNFADANDNTQTQNFCITPLGIHNDVEITLWSAGSRPGFDTHYHLVYKNKGNQIKSGTINFSFDDSVLDFVSATQAPFIVNTNNLNWAYVNLLPFESRSIDFILNLNGPTEIPAVNIGDVLDCTVSIDPISGDDTPGDNVFEFHQTVVSSIDPNDKTCVEGNSISPEKVGDYLHYVIRFQNSGTAAAENVVVKDMIDTAKFDIASLQLTESSHAQTTRITGNKVEFIFENINLPATSTDEPGSHGFVAFKIKTKNNLVLGNSVTNTANIFFDYNFPITTNTASTTIALLAKNTFEDQSVSVYPNPVKNKVHVSAKDKITSIEIFDVQGRLIETTVENEDNATLDLTHKTKGIYLLKINTAKGTKTEKIIKN